MRQIDSFSGQYRFLSNFYPSIIIYEGLIFPTAENLYQAAKCENPPDIHEFLHISPKKAKHLGRKVIIRDNWEDIKLQVMKTIIQEKFDQNNSLKLSLMITKPMELIEGNHWGDTFWGVCNGKGENHLGKILMEYRDAHY